MFKPFKGRESGNTRWWEAQAVSILRNRAGLLIAGFVMAICVLRAPCLIAQTCVAPPSGMIAWWTLDETYGTIAKDSIGTEPAAYFGTPNPIQTPGEVARALKFNGANDFLSAPQSSLWAFGANNFTIELWANFASPSGGGSIVEPGTIFIGNDEGPGNRNKWFFGFGGGVLDFTVYNTLQPPPNFYLVRAPFTPVLGKWYHLAVTKVGTTFTIYVNGIAVGSDVSLSPIAIARAPLTIGQAESLGYMNGLLDEISVYNRALSPAELLSIVNAGSAGKCKLPTASAVVPSVGGDAGQVTVTLSGSHLLPTSTVSLSASGLPSINGSTPVISPDGTSLVTAFNLAGQPDGIWDMVVNTIGQPTVTLPQAFTIEPATQPGQVWANVVGRGAIRVGQTQEFTLLVGNNSDTDAIDVPVWLTGIPTTATFTPQFALTQPPAVTGFAPLDPSLPLTITTATDIQVPLIVNSIPPGAVGTLQFSLLAADTSPIHLVTTTSSPLAPASTLALSTKGAQCLADLAQTALENLGVAQSAKCSSEILSSATTALRFLVDNLTPGASEPEDYPISIGSLGTSLEQTGLTCAQVALPPVAKVLLNAFDGALNIVSTFKDCSEAFSASNQGSLNVAVVRSYDPNAKQGSTGAGTQQYLSGAAPWPYTVAFENDATATAPAQTVTVTDQLDTAHLDLSTFSLGPMGFGGQQVVPPPGLSQFSTYLDLRPTTSLLVGMNASLNETTGVVTWSFNSLDPTTGLAPTNPLVGFLPPDVVAPEGDGQVVFSISPKKSLSTGQQIKNSASVVFDANAPVVTPAWSNTVDNSLPLSKVVALPAEVASLSFTVAWTGTDVGAGIQSYTIYVSDNGGAYAPWFTNTTSTSAVYTGQTGHTYGFYSIATDAVGNVEAAKTEPDTFVLVISAATVAVTPSSTSITTAQGLTITIAVSGGGSNPTPTGSVTLSSGSYTSLAATLTSGSATINIPAGSLTTGTDTLIATYTPDKASSATYSSATGSNAVIVTTPPATTALTLSANPTNSTYGQQIVLNATLSPYSAQSNSTNGETVVFYSGGASLGTAALSSGVATLNVTALSIGTDSLTAVYAGDTNFAPSTSNRVSYAVALIAPTISFTVGNQTYGVAPLMVAAISNSSGVFTYSVVSGPATISGSTVTLTGAGTVVLQADQAALGNYATGTQTATFTVAAEAPTISFTVANQTYGAAPFAVAAISNSSGSVTYSVVSGPATISGSTVMVTGAGTIVLQASQAAAGNYAAGSQRATFTASAATPTIFWNNPAPISYGSALTASQLNATASVPGVFVYSPVAGTILTTGSHSLSVTFTPTDTLDYTTSSVTVTITVNQAKPSITWSVPANITYGATLSPTQLNAIASVPGIFTYSPATGTVLAAGAHALSVTFTPTDAVDYTSATSSSTIAVNPAPLTMSAANASRAYGVSNPSFSGSISGAVNGDTFTVSGTTSATTSSDVGTYSIIPSVSGVDINDYAVNPVNGTLTIVRAGSATILASSNPNANLGSSVTFTASAASATTGIPTGTVNFFDDQTLLSSIPLNSQGVASYTSSSLATGSNSITAVYTGSANFVGSASTALIETVVAPDYSVTANPASLTVQRGQAGTANFTISPVGGFNQAVQFSCSGMPVHSSCAFSPASVTPSGSTVSSTLTISTDVNSSLLTYPNRRPSLELASYRGVAIWSCLLLWVFRNKRMSALRSSLLRMTLVAITLLGVGLFVVGCGTTPPPSPITPLGTSSVTITASTSASNGTSHTATLSLTVSQ